jgi:gamma-glutamylcyclotransferase
MSSSGLRSRTPSARRVSVECLLSHKLCFHKKSVDGSAKCDAFHTGVADDRVIGVLFDIDESEKKSLDKAEGLGYGYEQKKITVLTNSGKHEAIAYFAVETEIDSGLLPYNWYKYHVIVGAKGNGLPTDYIRVIEEVGSVADPDKRRNVTELSIYGGLEAAISLP